MTNQEAQNLIERNRSVFQYDTEILEAIDLAIKALEETDNHGNCVLTMFGKCSYKETGCSDCYLKERIRRALDEKCYEIGHADGARLGYEKGLNDARPKGKWITKHHVYGVTYCSECDFELKIDNTNYCPNCGAKMER